MEYNKNSMDIPYNLGSMFAVLELIQQKANPGINTTIKDKYFNSAASTPAYVFPVLMGLAQKHLRKLGEESRITFNKSIKEFSEICGKALPTRLTLPEQGAFQLGYYHQIQYQKKEEK